MTNKAIDPTSLDDLAATVDFSVKEPNKAKVSALLASIRNGVMRRAEVLPIDSPPPLPFAQHSGA